MSQTFHIVLCAACNTFQVHIVKKSSNKWTCKICNTKQSVQQVYAKGTGAECREIVKQLNQARGQAEENQRALTIEQLKQETAEGGPEEHVYNHTTGFPSDQKRAQSGISIVPPEQSKWKVFLEDS